MMSTGFAGQPYRHLVLAMMFLTCLTNCSLGADGDIDLIFDFQDLGTLGGESSSALSVNNRGQVVGHSDTKAGQRVAFLWKEGTMAMIAAEDAIDINDHGVVVGLGREGVNFWGQPESVAFRWSEASGLDTDLLPQVHVGLSPKEISGHARAINNNGDIAMIGQGIATYAILRRADGKCIDLGHFGGLVSLAYDLNDLGEVVGYSKVGRVAVHAFLYRNGTMLDLGSLGGDSGAHGINNKSQVVGSSRDGLARFRGFLWSEGKMHDLGGLSDGSVNARSINDHSIVVGNSETADREQHAFIWRQGTIRDLNELVPEREDWVISDAFKINEKNQIAATARRGDVEHAILLTPRIAPVASVVGTVTASNTTDQLPTPQSPVKTIGDSTNFHSLDAMLDEVAFRVTATSGGKAPTGYKAIDGFTTASPDFTRVAFTAERHDEKRRLAVIDGEVHPDYLIVNEIKFSPNSQRVAYFAHRPDGGGQLLYLDGTTTKVSGILKDLQFTPDSQQVVYVSSSNPVMRQEGGAQWFEAPGGVVRKGKSDRKFGMMGAIRVGSDSKLVAFTAVDNGEPVVVIDNEVVGRYVELPDFPFTRPPVISPDGKRTAFWAKRYGGWFTVIDGRESRQTFSDIHGLTFSPDSRRVAFAGEHQGSERLYVDGKAVTEALERIYKPIVFSPDSMHCAAAVSSASVASVTIDGKMQGRYDVVGSPVFSPDSVHCAYWAKKGSRHFVVCNGVEGPSFAEFGSNPVFSPDSRRLAYTAKEDGNSVLMVNGKVVDRAEEIDILSPLFGPDSKVIAYWAGQDGKWFLCANGVRSENSFREIVPAQPQVFDLEHCSSPRMCFASVQLLRAVGIDDMDEFIKLTVNLAPATAKGDVAAVVAPGR